MSAVPDRPIAAIDIGSNSGRIVVVQREASGHLEVLEEARAALRLVRDLDRGRELSDQAMARTIRALRGFRAVAVGAGVEHTLAVATAAVREAPNGAYLLQRIHQETGIRVDVIDGEQEARYAFLGAVHGLPVEHGMLVDVGGGSMQIVHFRDRAMRRYWTLPLGALRLSDRFLASDPPSAAEAAKLVDHVRETFAAASIPSLARDETVIGTGGSIRNLAKIDRRRRPYPIPRIHAYVLSLPSLAEVVDLVLSRQDSARSAVAGLNADRADSITGGALCVRTFLEAVGAPHIQVSGQGMREGLILESFGQATPSPARVRQAGVHALAARFTTWRPETALRRVFIANLLLEHVPGGAAAELRDALQHAATLLDIGRSIDYYQRHEHTATIATRGVLAGFSHRAIALVAAVARSASDDRPRVKEYAPLLQPKDRAGVASMGTLLALADDLERLYPAGLPLDLRCSSSAAEVVVSGPYADTIPFAPWTERFWRAFGRTLHIERSSQPVGASS